MSEKLTALAVVSSLALTDILYSAVDPAGAPLSKAITYANVLAPTILKAGRAGGQIIHGGVATAETLKLYNNAIDLLGIEIDGDGDVGIGGAPTSGYKLDVNGNVLSQGQINITDTTQATSPAVASLKTAGGFGCALDSFFGGDINLANTSSMAINAYRTDASIGVDNPLLEINAGGSDDGDYPDSARIRFKSGLASGWSATNASSRIEFWTTAQNETSPQIAMTINRAQNLKVIGLANGPGGTNRWLQTDEDGNITATSVVV